ncbi:hypothetical protein CDAR_102981 [Caerostris darwini]|uniref:Uncharacterized protein n=1 Tax=Caerostris darwini TaxID=1538125 RepID=A0AAV4VT27_9ARAC|nr:hypothetical protein CDAR_102981 [Caerostris darwini]
MALISEQNLIPPSLNSCGAKNKLTYLRRWVGGKSLERGGHPLGGRRLNPQKKRSAIVFGSCNVSSFSDICAGGKHLLPWQQHEDGAHLTTLPHPRLLRRIEISNLDGVHPCSLSAAVIHLFNQLVPF